MTRSTRDTIRTLINDYPKHYVKMIRSRYKDEIDDGSSLSWKEKIYQYLNGSLECPNGNQRKLVNFEAKFCGKANKCKCLRENLSTSSIKKAASKTKEQIQESNEKRRMTTLARYGVTNVGQTTKAKQEHEKFYSNASNVEELKQRQQTTLIDRYGVQNPAHIKGSQEKKERTSMQRYGVSNPMKDPVIKSKALQTRAKAYDPRITLGNTYEQLRINIPSTLGLDLLTTRDEYIQTGGTRFYPVLKFKCLYCNTVFSKRYDHASLPKCSCQKSIAYKSKEELDLLSFIESFGVNVISGDRSMIAPFEIDIYIPSLNLGIEYCGLYWHSENGGKKTWNYHKKKHDLALEQGIQLITIFSDEWNNKRDIVKSVLQAKMGFMKGFHGRKCEVRCIPKNQGKQFCDQYHLQGGTKTSQAVGLFLNDELSSVMLFLKKGDDYELSRYCSKMRIHGGASKMIRFFEKNNDYKALISFSDNRWSNGHLYNHLGFVKTSEIPAMQYYTDYVSKFHKLKARLLFEKIGTEWESAQAAGYDRIWDCGKIRWQKLKLCYN